MKFRGIAESPVSLNTFCEMGGKLVDLDNFHGFRRGEVLVTGVNINVTASRLQYEIEVITSERIGGFDLVIDDGADISHHRIYEWTTFPSWLTRVDE